MAPETTWGPTGMLTFDDLPYRLAAGLKGGVTAAGGAAPYTWTYQLASLTADAFDYFTVETGDAEITFDLDGWSQTGFQSWKVIFTAASSHTFTADLVFDAA